MSKVTFIKADVNLWAKHCPFLTAEQFKEGIVLNLPSGREVAFAPARGKTVMPCLTPRSSSGEQEWNSLAIGTVVTAEIR